MCLYCTETWFFLSFFLFPLRWWQNSCQSLYLSIVLFIICIFSQIYSLRCYVALLWFNGVFFSFCVELVYLFFHSSCLLLRDLCRFTLYGITLLCSVFVLWIWLWCARYFLGFACCPHHSITLMSGALSSYLSNSILPYHPLHVIPLIPLHPCIAPSLTFTNMTSLFHHINPFQCLP